MRINYDVADRFLNFLEPDTGEFIFQTYRDDKAQGGGEVIASSLFEKHEYLAKQNADGFGISVTVNETRGGGRKAEDTTRIRAVWQDDDKGDGGEFPLPPSVVVQSSPGRYHRYWLVEGDWPADLSSDEGKQGWDDFHRVMAGMVEAYGGDRNARDISRALRLPGTLNQKDGKGHAVEIVFPEDGEAVQRYTREQIVQAFARAEVDEVTYATAAEPDPMSIPVDLARVRDALNFISPDDREGWFDVGAAIHHATLSSDEGYAVWSEWSKGTSRNNYDPKEQRRAWKSFREKHHRPVTVATVFQKAKDNGWEDQNDHIELESQPQNSLPEEHIDIERSYGGIWVMRPDQAARCAVSVSATPSLNVTPSMTIGNWFAPFKRRHVFAAA